MYQRTRQIQRLRMSASSSRCHPVNQPANDFANQLGREIQHNDLGKNTITPIDNPVGQHTAVA
jgi:hypothetical protein